ncbi:arginyl-tRNA-protein transferase [Rhodobacterales bacterium HTCC2150]|nr:arginyl-tRNA-protein transferase [Rhodobacterales bacterium HTCC2150] [Rhodobacteraceae bacterium HTCC2150]
MLRPFFTFGAKSVQNARFLARFLPSYDDQEKIYWRVDNELLTLIDR